MKSRGRPPHPDILTPREWEVLERLAQPMLKNPYGQYLIGLLTERVF